MRYTVYSVSISKKGDEELSVNKVRVLRDFTARDEMELSVSADEVLVVLDDSRNWWHCRNEYNQIGYVPSNLLLKRCKQR